VPTLEDLVGAHVVAIVDSESRANAWLDAHRADWQLAVIDMFLAQGSGSCRVTGGIITFGGGVALYQNGKVIGGLGLSGDSACADHAIAYRMRALAGLAPPASVAGVGLNGTDNILYATLNTTPSGFEHPHCFPFDVTP